MKKIKSIYSKESEIQECINSAYNDLQILLQGAFLNIGKLPNQLTYDELFTLFESYDWNDLFNKLEELENCTDLNDIESVYTTLIESLKGDCNIVPIIKPWENTYYKVWAGLMTDEDF
jgi:hypothetical protein